MANRGDGGLSQCMYELKEELDTQYGPGKAINTYGTFNVKTEFLSTSDYQTLWGLRTTISQGENVITVEKDCRGYIEDISQHIEGNFALVFSQWSNEDGRISPDWQIDNCPLYDAGCSNAYATFSNIMVKQTGSN